MTEHPRLSPCARTLRRHDHDRYLTALFAPAERREALFGLFALNHELAKTPEVVSEALLGQIRLQWWRESLEGLYAGTPRRHEVLDALAPETERLPRAELERLLEAREADLEAAPPADLAALEAYAEATGAGLLRAALVLLGAEEEALRRAARHLGIAYALTGLLRAVPFHAGQKRVLLPEDHLAVAGVDRGALFELRPQEALSGVVMRLAGRAEEHLVEARRLAPSSRPAAPVLLHGSLAALYLKRLAAADYDPFDPRVAEAPPGRMPRLAWLAWRGRW